MHLAITVILIALLASAFADDDEHGHQDDDHEYHGVDPRGSRPRKEFGFGGTGRIGRCESSCPYNIDYVCGSNGVTYTNECIMKFETCQAGISNVKKMFDGRCEGQHNNRCETNCPYNIAYVCGSDGVTYSNECIMRVESCQAGKLNVFKLHDGECDNHRPSPGRCETSCPYNIAHVCGNDGVTYTNECTMRAENCRAGKMNVYKLHDGECERHSQCETACPFNIAYVCGSDGKTYTNECQMRAENCRAGRKNVRKLHEGECERNRQCETACPANIAYVCGSDGKTYSNECQMRSENCRAGNMNVYKQHDGECERHVMCQMGCPLNIAHVCGTDGVTYNNECTMRADSCRAGKTNVNKLHDGECAKPTCETGCPYNIAYVCGSDGMTYTNECTMRAESCLAGKPNVRKAYDGKCGSGGTGGNSNCQMGCPFNIAYVCGSDGKTYNNECVMKAESCQANTHVTKAYDGQCAICETNCPTNLAYVCGSDGKTYDNDCKLRADSCKAGNPGVYKVKNAKC